MRRLSWLLREAFSQWMWEGGEGTRSQRLARRLPWYFSDPDAHDLKNFDPESVTWTRTVGPPAINTGTGAKTVTITYGQD